VEEQQFAKLVIIKLQHTQKAEDCWAVLDKNVEICGICSDKLPHQQKLPVRLE